MERGQYQQSVDLDTRVVNYKAVKILGSVTVNFKVSLGVFSLNVRWTSSQDAAWKNINSHFSKC